MNAMNKNVSRQRQERYIEQYSRNFGSWNVINTDNVDVNKTVVGSKKSDIPRS
jgi:hypothetical protein